MARKLFCGRVGLPLAMTILFTAGALFMVAPQTTSGDSPKSPVKWDDRAAQELTKEFHQIHHLWNSGDIEALKKKMIGDDVLITFELGSDNRTGVTLRSREDVSKFIDKIAKESSGTEGTYWLDMPKMNCRATSDFGVCTEECTVYFKKTAGGEKVDKLFGTAVAVKYPDGWKWIQWHMSVAGPAQSKVGNAGN
ncbi:MAG TPA: nuclear transport factor 2 family protein [Blastocatellia bacterium]|jgi:DNA-binding ferritin-like protein (Dps family)